MLNSVHLTYDGPGRVIKDEILNTNTTGNRYNFSPLRHTTFAYEGRDKLTRSNNTMGAKDTLKVDYSGLGQAERTAYADHGTNIYNAALAYTSVETFKYDAMGNPDWRILGEILLQRWIAQFQQLCLSYSQRCRCEAASRGGQGSRLTGIVRWGRD